VISRTSAYALEAAVIIAQREGDLVRANELAEHLEIPANYLSKILNSMARGGLLESERGPHGGFRLSRHAGDIVIEDVIGIFEEAGGNRRCFLGRGKCTETDSCAMHEQWLEVSAPMYRFFRTTTLATLAADRTGRTGTQAGLG